MVDLSLDIALHVYTSNELLQNNFICGAAF